MVVHGVDSGNTTKNVEWKLKKTDDGQWLIITVMDNNNEFETFSTLANTIYTALPYQKLHLIPVYAKSARNSCKVTTLHVALYRVTVLIC